MNNPLNLPQGMQPQQAFMQHSEELNKIMNLSSQKAAQSDANFNGAQMQQRYNPDQFGGNSNKNLSVDNESEDAKSKRRSKNDVDGRDFKCKYCDKTYLSYPALYTHMKQKHSKGPDGEQRTPPTSGRGRGRPRKNPYQRTDPKSEEYFNAPERKGGPTDPLTHFEQVYEQLFRGDKQYKNYTDYPIYKFLVQFSTKSEEKSQAESQEKAKSSDDQNPQANPAEEQKGDAPGQSSTKKWDRNYDNLSDNERQLMLVDEIFALYLYKISQKVNEQFYKTVLMYVILFRECLNEIGWQKKIESEGIKIDEDEALKQKMNTQQFCLTNNAEHAPEICNEFVTVYMEHKRHSFDISKPDQIDLTINLCHWLFENQFTCSKLTMIS